MSRTGLTYSRLAWRLLLTASSTIFLAEGAIMWVLHQPFLSHMSKRAEGIVDAVLLALVSVPVLYLAICRPMASAEAALQQLNKVLEQRVDERTAALRQANEQLHMEIEERKRIETALSQDKTELTRLNNLMLGREERILELKQEINAILQELGRPARYSA